MHIYWIWIQICSTCTHTYWIWIWICITCMHILDLDLYYMLHTLDLDLYCMYTLDLDQ